MHLGIDGKLATITGASSGMGLATARVLAKEGVRLLLSDKDGEALEEAAEEFDTEVASKVADLTESAGILSLAETASDLGGADILVHAAGITGAKGDPLEMTDDDFVEAWETNFMSGVRLARPFVSGMANRGWGRVVYVVSENATQPYPDETVYNVAKASLLSWTKGLSLAYGPKGVLVNSVAPAFIETPMTDMMMQKKADENGVSVEEAIENFLEEDRPYLTLARRGQANEVAPVIALLCSERASFTNGSSYRVDGGSVAAIDT